MDQLVTMVRPLEVDLMARRLADLLAREEILKMKTKLETRIGLNNWRMAPTTTAQRAAMTANRRSPKAPTVTKRRNRSQTIGSPFAEESESHWQSKNSSSEIFDVVLIRPQMARYLSLRLDRCLR